MTAAQRERAALVETMRAVGPDAPTLCGDWTTRDLAAHLVIREGRVDASIGIVLQFLAGHTETLRRRTARSEWTDLLDRVAAGPPWYSPFKPVDAVAGMGELFIHHEDVRRARIGWEPREVDDATVTALSRGLPVWARFHLGRAPARITLLEPGGRALATVGRGPALTVTGAVPELLLFMSGRDQVRLEFDGDGELADAVRAARRRL